MCYFLDINTNTQTISVGITGAGAWVDRGHIPALQDHPRFQIAGIWGCYLDQAQLIGARFGIEPIVEFEELVLASDVVDLVVPPAVQPGLALVAERRLAVRVFVTRFFDLDRIATLRPLAAEARTRARNEWRSGSFLPGNPFATAWRARSSSMSVRMCKRSKRNSHSGPRREIIDPSSRLWICASRSDDCSTSSRPSSLAQRASRTTTIRRAWPKVSPW